MQLQARDKRALIAGAVVVTILLAILLWPRGSSGGTVELVPAAERGAATPASAAPTPQPAQPPSPTPAQPVAAAVAAAPATAPGGVPDGLKLTGVTATGAIFAFGDGSQRLVQRGREVAPGVVLQTVRVQEVILSANGATLRLSFSGPPVAVQAVPNPAPAPAANNPQQTPPPDRSLFR